MSLYKRTQRGSVLLWIIAAASAIILLAVLTAGGAYGTLLVLPALGLIAWLMSSLTVEASERDVCWWFGPGFWRKSVARADIVAARRVRNKWWYGFGIRWTPYGWLYNVGGLDAVQIDLASGRSLRIGTDDPDGLLRALSQR